MNPHPYVIAVDGHQYPFFSNGQQWLVSWHPPAPAPEGVRHGSAGACFTPDGRCVIVSEDGQSWVLPGGRPEGDEDWRQTLEREVQEEACARILNATLMGYSRGACIQGAEVGRVIVRAAWHADVVLEPWKPQFEIVRRLVVQPEEAARRIVKNEVYARLFHEALKIDALKIDPAAGS
jgi:8-oxo-dGTP pyrophosphatase MutT (NUDIX family)